MTNSVFCFSEKYVLKFLPKLLKNSNIGSFMGKEGRLCSPRFIFFFEKCLNKDVEGILIELRAFFLNICD